MCNKYFSFFSKKAQLGLLIVAIVTIKIFLIDTAHALDQSNTQKSYSKNESLLKFGNLSEKISADKSSLLYSNTGREFAKTNTNESRIIAIDEEFAQFIRDPDALDVTDVRETISKHIREGKADEALMLLDKEEINISRGLFLRFRSSAYALKNLLAKSIKDLEDLRLILIEENPQSSDLHQVNFDLMFLYFRAGFNNLALETAIALEKNPEIPTYYHEQIALVKKEVSKDGEFSRDISVLPDIAIDFNDGISKSNYKSYYDGQTSYYEYIEQINPFVRSLGRSYEVSNDRLSKIGWAINYGITGTLSFKLPPQKILAFYAGAIGKLIFNPGLEKINLDYTSTQLMSGFYISWLSGAVSRTLNFRFSRTFTGDYSQSLYFVADASLGIPISRNLFYKPGFNIGTRAYDNSSNNISLDLGLYSSIYYTLRKNDTLSLYASYTRSKNKDDLNSYNRYTFSPGYDLNFDSFGFDIDFNLSHTQYDKFPFGNTDVRKDISYGLSLTVIPKTINILQKNIALTLGFSANTSNYKAVNSSEISFSFSTRKAAETSN